MNIIKPGGITLKLALTSRASNPTLNAKPDLDPNTNPTSNLYSPNPTHACDAYHISPPIIYPPKSNLYSESNHKAKVKAEAKARAKAKTGLGNRYDANVKLGLGL